MQVETSLARRETALQSWLVACETYLDGYVPEKSSFYTPGGYQIITFAEVYQLLSNCTLDAKHSNVSSAGVLTVISRHCERMIP